jgi:dipeptidyl aminopeptidase/acylaminoacyl peptidase
MAGTLPVTDAKVVKLGFRPLVVGVPVTTRRYSGPSALAFSPDGTHLAFISGMGPSFAAWRVPVAGGDPELFLEIPDANLSGLSWSSSGDLVCSAHRGGTERWQIYVRRADGRIDNVSVSDAVQHLLSSGAIAPDGDRVAFSTNARNAEDVDVAIGDLGGGSPRLLVSGRAWHVCGRWSPDGRLLQVMRVEENTDQYVLLVDPSNGAVHEITPHSGEEQNVPAGWLADGRPIVITNRGREHLWLAVVDPDTGMFEAIDAPEWGVDVAASSEDGSTQVWTVNEDGWNRLRWRADGREVAEVPGLDGVIGDVVLSRDGARAAYAYMPVTGPEELHILDTASGDTVTLLRGDADVDERLRPDSIRIPGPAGDIPAYIYRADGLAPALLVIHGGPEGQSRPRLPKQLLRLLEAGITILVPNIHGSTGYGKSWQTAIHRDWGGVDLEDFRAIADWMVADTAIDSERIGVYGGSYGGFATLTCITRLPEYWRCAVDVFGPCNLVTSLEDAEPNWRRWNLKWIGDLRTDREKLVERSPLTHADNVHCAVLVIAGTNDPRVRKHESDQFVERMRALGREVEYLVFEDEGHGVTRPENMATSMRTIEEFLLKHLT